MVTLQDVIDVCKTAKWKNTLSEVGGPVVLRTRVEGELACPVTYYVYKKTGQLFGLCNICTAIKCLDAKDKPTGVQWAHDLVFAADYCVADTQEIRKQLLGEE